MRPFRTEHIPASGRHRAIAIGAGGGEKRGVSPRTVALLIASLVAILAVGGPVHAVCGDGDVGVEEECDDGNPFGGDGCAANCTTERLVTCALRTASATTLQTDRFAIPAPLVGQIALAVGRLRPATPDEAIPFVLRAAESFIAPALVSVIGISCTTPIESEEWGPGNAGGGIIDCGPTRFDGVDVQVTADGALPEAAPAVARAGSGPLGSAIFELSLSSHALSEGSAACVSSPNTGPAGYGADATACTADDPIGEPRTFHGSTGAATARIVNAGDGEATVERTVSGIPLDCTRFDGNTPLDGATLVAARPLLSVPLLGDSAVTVELACGDASPAPTTTPRFVRTCAPTPSQTATPSPADTRTSRPTATATPIATASAPPTASPTGGVPPACAGDCNGDGSVTIDELVRAVNIALGSLPIVHCAPIDGDADGNAAIDELVRAVNATLQGCPV